MGMIVMSFPFLLDISIAKQIQFMLQYPIANRQKNIVFDQVCFILGKTDSNFAWS